MKLFINISVCVAILAAGVVGLRLFGQKPEVPKETKPAGELAVAVVSEEVTAYNQPLNVDVDGEAVTYRVVAIGAEVEGRVVRKTMAARGGTYVREGELLFEIDSTSYDLAVERLKAQLQQATEEIASVTVDVDNTKELIKLADEDWALQKKNLVRMQSLLTSGTANEREVEEAQKQELTARNALQLLQNQQKTLTQSEKTKQANRKLVSAELKRAELNVQRCVVKSSLQGRVVEDEVEEGDYVKMGDTMVHISDGSKMEIKCQLRGEELAWVWQQKIDIPDKDDSVLKDPLNLPPVPCEVRFEFEDIETIWEGYVSRIEGTGIDRETRTFPCRVVVDEPQKTRVDDTGGRPRVALPGLLSGMFVSVRIPVLSPVPILKLPLEAVRPGGQIWIKQGETPRIRTVSLAHVEGPLAFVRQLDSGLSPGDRVIVSPLASVRDGMKVTEENDEPAAEESAPAENQPTKAVPNHAEASK